MTTLTLSLTDSAKYDRILNLASVNLTGQGDYDGRELGESSIISLTAAADMVEWVAYIRLHDEAASKVTRAQYARLLRFVRQRIVDIANRNGDNGDELRRMVSIHYLNLMSVGHNPGIRRKVQVGAAQSTVGASHGVSLDTTLPSVMRQYGEAAAKLADQLTAFDNDNNN